MRTETDRLIIRDLEQTVKEQLLNSYIRKMLILENIDEAFIKAYIGQLSLFQPNHPYFHRTVLFEKIFFHVQGRFPEKAEIFRYRYDYNM